MSILSIIIVPFNVNNHQKSDKIRSTFLRGDVHIPYDETKWSIIGEYSYLEISPFNVRCIIHFLVTLTHFTFLKYFSRFFVRKNNNLSTSI